MQRCHANPRTDWQQRLEDLGLTYHSHDDGPYWDESVFYELDSREVDALENAANALHRLCIEAAEVVIREGWWSRLRIPQAAVPIILRSWERDEFSAYGRFDLAFDGREPPKLLEYNADTPTALLEAAVAQWFWQQEIAPGADQFNSIHERLIEAWRRWDGGTLHFSGVRDHPEDEQTVLHLRDTCEQAGIHTIPVFIEDIGPTPQFEGHHPVFGVWVVDHEAAGLGIREDTRRITGNLSRFVPHLFRQT